jgi:hypothetical protein
MVRRARAILERGEQADLLDLENAAVIIKQALARSRFQRRAIRAVGNDSAAVSCRADSSI